MKSLQVIGLAGAVLLGSIGATVSAAPTECDLTKCRLNGDIYYCPKDACKKLGEGSDTVGGGA
jgi:hypothetical protein